MSDRIPTFIEIPTLAERWETTTQAIYNLRHRGEGPPSLRIGKKVKYRLVDVIRWEEERIAQSDVSVTRAQTTPQPPTSAKGT